MTGRWFLEELAEELGEIPRFYSSDLFKQCVNKLLERPQMLIIDEIDYLASDAKAIETIRDIHDKTNVPIIFVGMGLAHKKIERFKHLFDRFSEIVKFETFSIADLKEIIEQLSEISITAEAIEIIHKKYNRFRQIVQLINQLETIAKENNLAEITEETVRLVFR